MINPHLPLVDLHRHLDGNIRPSTIFDLSIQHNIPLPADSLESLIPIVQITDKTSDLLAFLQRLDYGVSVLADLDACQRVAYENMQDAQREGIDYVELRFSPYYMAKAHGLPLRGVIEAVIDGVHTGQSDFGVQSSIVGILSRTFGTKTCHDELEALLAYRQHISALDLAGDEIHFPAEDFIPHFQLARDAGWGITVHAGEAAGPESIWSAIKHLGATRIGHGVAACKDQTLMEYLATQGIGIESCPTSNYQTATITDLTMHPMKLFHEQGITVTINTDDPGVSAIDLAHEYGVAKSIIGFNDEQLSQIQRNGVMQAFISQDQKTLLFSAPHLNITRSVT